MARVLSRPLHLLALACRCHTGAHVRNHCSHCVQETTGDINVGQFVTFARKKKELMEQIFTVFDKYLNFPEFIVPPQYIPPPNPDEDAETAV